jgi:3',5'-nucleoside bisphosphate phosphatase
MIDLHTHSTFSDGSLTPNELARAAAGVGLAAVALTDHDGVTGTAAFIAACAQEGLRGIAGVEISVDFNPGTMHMLGYFVDSANRALEEALVHIRSAREDRNQAILRKLIALGCALTWDEVAAYAGEDVVGRPHFAQALEARGFVKSKDEAFERLLGKGRPAYADRYRLTAEESIRLIRGAGGVPVLAHPFTLGLEGKPMRECLQRLAAGGLQGLEAYYPEHSPDMHHQYLQLARELGLAVTGGSDFHGAANPDIKLGIGFGNLRVPDDLLAALEARRPQP